LGSFVGGSHEVRNAVGDLTRDFAPDAYHLIHKNCNHFANAFVYRLLRKEIPPFVNRLANIGGYMSCLLPKKMLETAPVGGTAGGDSGTGALFRAYPPVGSSTGTVRWNNKSSTGTSSSHGIFRRKEQQHVMSRLGEDETDLQEKVRLAAIKRWENQKK
jgi:PPPDE putative peptidase domain.